MYPKQPRPIYRQLRQAPKPAPRKKQFVKIKRSILLIIIIAAVVGGPLLFISKKNNTSILEVIKPGSDANFNKQQYSVNSNSSLWVVINKKRPVIPIGYVPGDLVIPNIAIRASATDGEKYLRNDAAGALKNMADDASKQSVRLNLQSGYRSYELQASLYELYVRIQGQSQADHESARAGYSEHQTGLAADVGSTTDPSCDINLCYANTAEGKWLAANAYKYGFIIRYPADKENITGYSYEPWHVRYVGTDLSNEMHKQVIDTLEEFFGLGAAPNY